MPNAGNLGNRMIVLLWSLRAAALAVAVVLAVITSPAFAPEHKLAAMPIMPFVVGMLVASFGLLAAIPLICRSSLSEISERRDVLVGVLAIGLAFRLALLASEPILEVDFNRYLWDGALTANGYNPFAVAPAAISNLPYNDIRLELSKAAGPVFEGISYPELKTIYPPVAQLAFALAYLIEPWSLTAWRCVCIAADLATVGLLLALLRSVGRSQLWSILYWWHPLVLKEVVNSAHMEAILLPLVLSSLLLGVRGRHRAAVGVLGLAVGTKLWPVMLLPLLLRPLIARPSALATALGLIVLIGLACVAPIWPGGLDASSGFIGFANHWATNSALFPQLERLAALLVGDGGPERILPGRVVRLVSATAVLSLALWVARAPICGANDLLARAYLVVTALLLLSPAQFPWYVLWVLPLAVLRPGFGWHVAAATLPLYYLAFHFRARESFWIYEFLIVWAIWLPVWLTLVGDAVRARRPAPAG